MRNLYTHFVNSRNSTHEITRGRSQNSAVDAVVVSTNANMKAWKRRKKVLIGIAEYEKVSYYFVYEALFVICYVNVTMLTKRSPGEVMHKYE
jgi:hypothetical protein